MTTLVYAIASTKGGCGKSTISIHLSVVAAATHRVLLVDADPQGTVSTWGATRTSDLPVVVKANPSSIREIIDAARVEGFTLVVIDCPPHAIAGTADLLTMADHVVIPCQPTMPDIVATQQAVTLVIASRKPYSFVISRAPSRAPEVLQTQMALACAGDVSPVVIGDRRAFSRALTDSLAVTEMVHGEKASFEILSYWEWLYQHTQPRESATWQNKAAA
jgi:chromosome partitioning protein